MPWGDGEVVVIVTGTQEFRRVSAQLKAAGDGRLVREMRRGMRRAADPMLREAKANVLGLNVKGARGSGRRDRYEHALSRSRKVTEAVKQRAARGRGLRSSVANATRIEVTGGANAGVRMRTNTRMMPADQRKLPAHLNTGRWRHPVFGNRSSWVTQTAAAAGWFDRSTVTHGPRIRDGARDVLDNIIERIG